MGGPQEEITQQLPTFLIFLCAGAIEDREERGDGVRLDPQRRMREARAFRQRNQAVLALARATFAAGGGLLTTANGVVAPVLSRIGHELPPPVSAEMTRWEDAPVRVVVVESREPDQALRARIGPRLGRRAVLYLDRDLSPLEGRFAEVASGATRRQPVTADFLGAFAQQLRGAVVLSPLVGMEEEAAVLQGADMPVVVFQRTSPEGEVPSAWRGLRDPTEDYLRTTDVEARPDRIAPYGYLFERLLREWTEDREPERRAFS